MLMNYQNFCCKSLSLTTLLFPVLLNAQNTEFNKSYPISQNSHFDIRSTQVNIEGSITTDEKEANIISIKFVGKANCELSENLSDGSVKLSITDKSQNVPWYKKIFSFNADDCNGTLFVSAPQHVIFSANTVSGSITLNRIQNIAQLISVSGDINISSFAVEDADTIQTVSGSVSILCSNLTSKLIKTVSGDVKIATNALKSEITSTSGDITITAKQSSDNVFVKNISGDMSFSILENPGSVPSKIDFKTVSGNIMVKLPGAYSAQIDTKTVSGGEDIGIKNDTVSPLRLSAKSVSGDISVLPL